MRRVTLDTIREAQERISGVVRATPLIRSDFLSDLSGGEVYLKLENQQITNSFKIRGALNRMSVLSKEDRARGVTTASSGNHAQGVAYSSQYLKIPAIIVVPRNISEGKMKKLQQYNVEVIREGEFDEVESLARDIAYRQGLTYISPYSDVEIISGQGTIGLEILERLDGVNVVIVPVGGGGLISGIATTFRSLCPTTTIAGVQVVGASTMHDSWRAGRIVHPEEANTLADGILGGLEDGAMTFDIVMDKVDDFHLVQEETVERAIRILWRTENEVVEGAGAIAIGPILENPRRFSGKSVVAVISGGNIESEILERIINEA